MYSVRYVFEDARLIQASNRDPEALVDELLRQIRSRGLPIGGDNQPDWHYPVDLAYAAPARAALLTPRPNGPLAELRLPVIADLLRRARVGYRLADASQGAGTPQFHAAVLGGTYELGSADERWSVLAKVTLDWSASGRQDRAAFSLDERWFDLDELEPLTLALEEIYLAAERNHRRNPDHPQRPMPRVAWLGGNRAANANWDERLAAAARVQGFTLHAVERPHEHRPGDIKQLLVGDAPWRVFVWSPYCPGATKILAAAGNVEAILIEHADLEVALAELRAALDAVDVDAPEEAVAQGVGPPVTGETRYYKKKYALRNRDVMVRCGSRNDRNWQPAHHAGPKALKGITALEGQEPAKLWKCLTCTGGGHWMAEF